MNAGQKWIDRQFARAVAGPVTVAAGCTHCRAVVTASKWCNGSRNALGASQRLLGAMRKHLEEQHPDLWAGRPSAKALRP